MPGKIDFGNFAGKPHFSCTKQLQSNFDYTIIDFEFGFMTL